MSEASRKKYGHLFRNVISSLSVNKTKEMGYRPLSLNEGNRYGPNVRRMEVMLWEVLSRNARKRCASINTGSCWLAPDTKKGRNDGDNILTIFTKEQEKRRRARIQKARCLSYP